MKLVLRCVGVVGTLIFGFFFYLTYSVPGYVEGIGKDFIKIQIEKQTNEKIDDVNLQTTDGRLRRFAEELAQRHQEQIERLRVQLKNKVHEEIAAVVAEMRDLDCECRKKYALWYKEGFELEIASLQDANEKLQDFMKAKYMEVVTELKRDVRIFTGSNATVFLLVLLVSFFKPKAVAHLFFPALLLLTSTLVCSYFYIFEQNWLFTIIYNDYLGLAYLAYVGVVFLFLCDIALNRARVTSEILNAVFNAIGSAVSVAPC